VLFRCFWLKTSISPRPSRTRLRGLKILAGDSPPPIGEFGLSSPNGGVGNDYMKRITDEICIWEHYDPNVRTILTSTAIRPSSRSGWWLIDPIDLPPEPWPFKKPAGILLTSRNHDRSSQMLSRRFHVPIHGPSFPGGQPSELKGFLQIIPIEGAGPEEKAMYFSQPKVLVLGDALINLEQTGFTFLPDKYCSDPMLMRQSLKESLLDLNFEILVFAHGRPIQAHPRKKLSDLIGIF
jgi:hypothetical protein